MMRLMMKPWISATKKRRVDLPVPSPARLIAAAHSVALCSVGAVRRLGRRSSATDWLVGSSPQQKGLPRIATHRNCTPSLAGFARGLSPL